MSGSGNATTFTITDIKLYVPIITLKTEDNTKLLKLLSKGFKGSIYQNKYKISFKNYNNEYIRERLDASFQGINKFFVLSYASGNNITDENSHRKYFLPRITKKKITISKLMVETFMINQLMTQLNNMTKLEKYQQDKVIILLVVYQIFLLLKKIID